MIWVIVVLKGEIPHHFHLAAALSFCAKLVSVLELLIFPSILSKTQYILWYI